jgi:hypothetical protein
MLTFFSLLGGCYYLIGRKKLGLMAEIYIREGIWVTLNRNLQVRVGFFEPVRTLLILAPI